MYDAIVVGARCAGSPTAMLLAQQGYRVLLLDRAAFPSDTVSTHFIWLAGVARLHRWGLLDKVRASNCPPVTDCVLDIEGCVLRGSPPPTKEGIREAFAPRRTVLDKILVDAAIAAGAEFRDGFTVEELVFDNGPVSGIRGHGRNGTAVFERARIVIGADGMRSLVARAVNAPRYRETEPLCASYYTYWSGVPTEGFELCARVGWGMGAIPTNDGLTCVVVGWNEDRFPGYKHDIEGTYLKSLELNPSMAERVRGGKREEKYMGIVALPSFFRKPYGEGWALVGDAGYYKHPLPAQGITDAFRDAELLAGAIHEGFSGARSLDEALADYQRVRDEAVMPMYESTITRAALKPLPLEMKQVFEAVRLDQDATDRLFGTDAGTVPIPEFFCAENVGRILAGLPLALASRAATPQPSM